MKKIVASLFLIALFASIIPFDSCASSAVPDVEFNIPALNLENTTGNSIESSMGLSSFGVFGKSCMYVTYNENTNRLNNLNAIVVSINRSVFEGVSPSTVSYNGRNYYTYGLAVSNSSKLTFFSTTFNGPIFYNKVEYAQRYYVPWPQIENYLINDVLEGDIRDMLPPSADEIGYLTDVKYFVDSAAYQYNPTDTPEFIQWGDKSTTGLDLTDSRYQVEFALEDKSSYYQNTANDYISASGFDPTGQFGSWYREMRNYVGSLVFPSGSNARAILQGKSVNTAFNGKFISAGITAASNRQYRISAVARYLNGLSATIEADNLLESSDEWAFRNFLQGYSANPSRGYGGHLAQNISQLGRLYSMSYNIMARIVDSTSGAVGNWTKIDRHNTPYWDGAEEDTLNGRITRTDGYRYTVNNFGDTFVSGGGEDQTTEKKLVIIPVGYWDIDNNIGRPIYNNYNYTTNNYHYDGDINNFVYQNRDGNDADGTGGIMETIGILGWMSVLLSWYNTLFGAVLPTWAQLCIPVFGVIFAAVLVWKFGRLLL